MSRNNNNINFNWYYLQLIINLLYALFINYTFYVMINGWEFNPKNWAPYLTPVFIITTGIVWAFFNFLPNLLNDND